MLSLPLIQYGPLLEVAGLRLREREAEVE